jgi:phosphoenolpyruvate carboxykinase (GTP)
MIQRNTLFTNVALTADNQPWWEGLESGTPVTDWQGRPFDAANGPAAQPNSRFTVSAKQNPCYSPQADSAKGVPISAIIFGGRRRGVAPLVYEARDWNHGVLVGASVASETTAAAIGQAGVLRRDPMAMKPFAGYNYGDYWAHWFEMGKKLKHPPKIYHVNWFRRDADGKFLWPGFGDNLRVLAWILNRCAGKAEAQETPIGNLPRANDLNLNGLKIEQSALDQLLSVNSEEWRAEAADMDQYLNEFGDRTPVQLRAEVAALRTRLA